MSVSLTDIRTCKAFLCPPASLSEQLGRLPILVSNSEADYTQSLPEVVMLLIQPLAPVAVAEYPPITVILMLASGSAYYGPNRNRPPGA